MKNKLLLSAIAFLALSGTALAHNPRMVEGGTTPNILNPEVSQAFYGTLDGKAQLYFINSLEPFRLYAGLLVPDLPDSTQDFSAEISQVGKYIDDEGKEASEAQSTSYAGKKTVLSTLDGTQMKWERFHEEFGNDWYRKGPETAPMDSAVALSPAGLYAIKISNPGNQGKYVLVVGTKEKWTLEELWNTLITMPRQKTFFDKSPFLAFFNKSGLVLLPVALFFALALAVFIRRLLMVANHLKRKRTGKNPTKKPKGHS
jgi:hypothetical protein